MSGTGDKSQIARNRDKQEMEYSQRKRRKLLGSIEGDLRGGNLSDIQLIRRDIEANLSDHTDESPKDESLSKSSNNSVSNENKRRSTRTKTKRLREDYIYLNEIDETILGKNGKGGSVTKKILKKEKAKHDLAYERAANRIIITKPDTSVWEVKKPQEIATVIKQEFPINSIPPKLGKQLPVPDSVTPMSQMETASLGMMMMPMGEVPQVPHTDNVYCICRKSDETRMMIQCDFCSEWYHFHCIGLDETKALEYENKEYRCPPCEKRGTHNKRRSSLKKPANTPKKRNDGTLSREDSLNPMTVLLSAAMAATSSTLYGGKSGEKKEGWGKEESSSSVGSLDIGERQGKRLSTNYHIPSQDGCIAKAVRDNQYLYLIKHDDNTTPNSTQRPLHNTYNNNKSNLKDMSEYCIPYTLFIYLVKLKYIPRNLQRDGCKGIVQPNLRLISELKTMGWNLSDPCKILRECIQDRIHNLPSIYLQEPHYSIISKALIKQSEIEERMSLKDELSNRFDIIQIKTQNELKNLRQLLVFLNSQKSALEKLSKSLSKSLNPLSKQIVNKNFQDTIGVSWENIIQELTEFSNSIEEKNKRLHFDIIEPLEMFAGHFENTNKGYIKEALTLLTHIKDYKRKVFKAREKYFRYCKLHEEGQLGAEDARMRQDVRKLSSLKETKVWRRNTKEEYMMIINECNGYIVQNDGRYGQLLDSLQHNEQERIKNTKSSLVKFFGLSQAISQEFMYLSEDIMKVVTQIDAEKDIEKFIAANQIPDIPNNFAKEEFIDYEYKNPEDKNDTDSQPKTQSGPVEELKEAPPAPKQKFKQKSDPTGDDLRMSGYEPTISNIDQISASGEFEEFIVVEEHPQEVDNKLVMESIKKLLNNEIMEIEERAKLFELMHLYNARMALMKIFNSINCPQRITNEDSFKLLVELANYLLTALAAEAKQDLKCLLSVLRASQLIYLDKQEEGRSKRYLRSLIINHGIWQDADEWKEIVEFVVSKKILEFKRKWERQKARMSPRKNAGKGEKQIGTGKKIFAGLSKFMGKYKKEKGEEDSSAYDGGLKMSIYSGISECISYLLQFAVPIDIALNIILYHCYGYHLDPEKIVTLVAELESGQTVRTRKLSMRDNNQLSLLNRDKERRRFGFSNDIMIMGLSLKYLSHRKDLRNILVVSKGWNEVFKKHVYKQVMSGLPKLTMTERLELWKSMLDIKEILIDYDALKEKVNSEAGSEIIENIADVITMDVQRSFHKFKRIQPDSMINVLRTYAFYNPMVEYCQGMNFIAGFLCMLFQEESTVFKVFMALIDRLSMSQLFQNDVPLLRLYFYQVNRLLALFLPNIHEHFRNEGVNVSHFCSSWFLTLFTTILQHSDPLKDSPPEFLMVIWDHFLLDGWKTIFKTAIFILSYYEDKLLEMSFEQMVVTLGELTKTDFFQNTDIIEPYLKALQNYNVNNDLLRTFETEYTKILKISTQDMEKYRENASAMSPVKPTGRSYKLSNADEIVQL